MKRLPNGRRAASEPLDSDSDLDTIDVPGAPLPFQAGDTATSPLMFGARAADAATVIQARILQRQMQEAATTAARLGLGAVDSWRSAASSDVAAATHVKAAHAHVQSHTARLPTASAVRRVRMAAQAAVETFENRVRTGRILAAAAQVQGQSSKERLAKAQEAAAIHARGTAAEHSRASAALQAHAIRRGAVAIGQPGAPHEGAIVPATSRASSNSPPPSVDIDALVATVQQQSVDAPDSAEIRKSLDVYRSHAAHYVSKLYANHGNEGLQGLLDQIATQEESQGQNRGTDVADTGDEEAPVKEKPDMSLLQVSALSLLPTQLSRCQYAR